MSARTGTAAPPTIVATGTVSLDTVETSAAAARSQVGGSTLYFAAAAAITGVSVGVVGVAGDDLPLSELEPLRRRGVDLSGLRLLEGPNMAWHARYVGPADRETLARRPGVSLASPVVPPGWRGAEHVFLGSQSPLKQRAVLAQLDGPRIVALDTMSHWIGDGHTELTDLVSRCDVLFVNELEAGLLAGVDEPVPAAMALRAKGPAVVVIKRGDRGAVAAGADDVVRVGAWPTSRVLDPTGAGDAFAGAFMAAVTWSGELDRAALRRALRYGAAAGSLAVEGFGISGLAATRKELERRASQLAVGGVGSLAIDLTPEPPGTIE